MEFGTPQGSFLGPLLFLLLTNDLYLNKDYCRAILFADDTTVYKSHRNIRYWKWCIEQDLMAISDWFKANKLTLNVGKTVYMFFGNSKCNSKPNLEINQITLEPLGHTKFLGMWVDENLNWNIHINKLRMPKNLFDERTLTLITMPTFKVIPIMAWYFGAQ